MKELEKLSEIKPEKGWRWSWRWKIKHSWVQS